MPRSSSAKALAALAVGASILLFMATSLPVLAADRGSSGSAVPPSHGRAADDGARIIDVQELGERTVDLTIDSPAVGVKKVRLLLPQRFDEAPDARWPVLYLLHGCCGGYAGWTDMTDVEALTADTDLLVVMPEAGAWGWYSDWWNDGAGGPPKWETFHVTELSELLERNWNAGDRRVVAGASMGGLGAMSYAARHPGLFLAAASFSGMLDTRSRSFQPNSAIWGDRTEQEEIWAAHDPISLAPALRDLVLYVSYGDGEHAPSGQIAEDLEQWAAGGLERLLVGGNQAFISRLEELGIAVSVDTGMGTHGWDNWERALARSLPLLLDALDE